MGSLQLLHSAYMIKRRMSNSWKVIRVPSAPHTSRKNFDVSSGKSINFVQISFMCLVFDLHSINSWACLVRLMFPGYYTELLKLCNDQKRFIHFHLLHVKRRNFKIVSYDHSRKRSSYLEVLKLSIRWKIASNISAIGVGLL